MAVALALSGCVVARAQYYEIANQLPGLLSPALSGSMKYKGFVEFSGHVGLGENRANFAGVSTSQGFQYSSWFFMGAGVGIEATVAQNVDGYDGGSGNYPDYWNHGYAKTKVMVPVFTDFRFTIGAGKSASVNFGLKVGAAWLLGSDYLRLHSGCVTNSTQFFLRPSIGMRIPVNTSTPSQAVFFGISYQLLTSNNNYNWHDRSLTLNSLGATIGFEW